MSDRSLCERCTPARPTLTRSRPFARPRATGWLAALLLATASLGCQVGIPGNGELSTEDRALTGFSRVEGAGSLDVQATQGEAFSVTVRIDSNLQRYVLTRVEGDTLVVDESRAVDDTVNGPQVLVTMPRLVGARVSGSGWLAAGRFVQPDGVRLDLDGSGDLRFSGEVPSVEARLDGSGDLRIEGVAETVDLHLEGSGDVDARGCSATSAEIASSGSGDASATVSGSSRVALSGSGDVYLYGAGKLERAAVSGSGDVHQR